MDTGLPVFLRLFPIIQQAGAARSLLFPSEVLIESGWERKATG